MEDLGSRRNKQVPLKLIWHGAEYPPVVGVVERFPGFAPGSSVAFTKTREELEQHLGACGGAACVFLNGNIEFYRSFFEGELPSRLTDDVVLIVPMLALPLVPMALRSIGRVAFFPCSLSDLDIHYLPDFIAGRIKEVEGRLPGG